MSGRTLRRIGIAAALAVIVIGPWVLWGSPDLASRIDRDALEALVAEAGAAGPMLVVGLMILAVVASPIPSAPIALASGAAYGHTLGTIWVVLARSWARSSLLAAPLRPPPPATGAGRARRQEPRGPP